MTSLLKQRRPEANSGRTASLRLLRVLQHDRAASNTASAQAADTRLLRRLLEHTPPAEQPRRA